MTILEAAPVTAVSRLLGPDQGRAGPDLDAHLRRHGPLVLPGPGRADRGPRAPRAQRLLDDIERSGLTGRGGAGFPTHRKLRSPPAGGLRPVLLVNAMEGEPASAKDRFLMGSAPHLVLDGADLVAEILGAERVVVCLPDDRPEIGRLMTRALAERAAAGLAATPVEVKRLAGRYIAGEESALVAGATGRPGLPQFRPDKSVALRLGRRPGVVHNVETLAQVALIARHGPEWFRMVGTAEAPGTCLVTISGAVEHPGVVEVPTGTPIEQILQRGRPTRTIQAVLVGGYGGSWLAGDQQATPYAPLALQRVGASMGAGILVALPVESCGIRETERIARFMAAESAGQCGPCLFGLPAIADDLADLANATGGPAAFERLVRHAEAVDGRGACRHPDGVARLVRSALRVFSADLAGHVGGRACAGSGRPSLLVLPPVGPKGDRR